MRDEQLHHLRDEQGFTLIEVIVAMAVLLVVSASVMRGVLDAGAVHASLANRTDMQANVRNVSTMMSQEIGQAGSIALPAAVTVSVASAVGATSLTVNSAAGMFVGEFLRIDTGASEETVTITAIAGNALTVSAMGYGHAIGAPVTTPGGFAAGVVPPGAANGSTATRLKIFGDLNGDGNMQYVEYTCDVANARLYRNGMAFTAGAKPALTIDRVLVDNLLANPDGTPCFQYQTVAAFGTTFVRHVAVTLTLRSQIRDNKTNAFQNEQKFALDVSPRNILNLWKIATTGVTSELQPTPATVTALLP